MFFIYIWFMLKSPSALAQPSNGTIFYNQFIRYIKVGSFLHIMGLLGILLSFISFKISLYYFAHMQLILGYLLGLLAFCCFTVPFFAEFDAYGRYQNYKQIKDSLFEMGYDQRLLKPFMRSKCQRDSVIVAAQDLNHDKEVEVFFHDMGYRKYHILPDSFNRNPLVLFTPVFWKQILFNEYYASRNFYW